MDRFIRGFFIEYQIISFQEQKFPLWPNLSKNEILFLDQVLIEDLVKFCKMKGKVIRGYYYNGNRDKKIRDVIKEIFQLYVASSRRY
jgi:hypothetical protein